MKNIVFIAFVWVLSIGISSDATAQNTSPAIQNPLITGTIDSQFFHLNRISRTQEGFKLIRRPNLDLVRQNVLDSIHLYQSESIAKSEEIANLQNEIVMIRDSLAVVNQDLAALQKESATIDFMGMSIHGVTYHLIVWGLILTFLILLIFIFIRSRQNNVSTRDAKDNLAVLQEEFDVFRKKSLEKEQKLKRQLQDEINKGNA